MKISSNNNNNNNDKYSKFYLPHSSFKQVCKIAQDYNIKIVHRLKEGKYIILGRIMFVRVSITWKASFVHFKILLLQEISLPHNGFGLPNPPPPHPREALQGLQMLTLFKTKLFILLSLWL